MDYLFLAISIVSAVLNNTFLHLPVLRKGKVDEFFFNAGVVAVWIVLLAAYNGGIQGYSDATFLYGALYGVILAGFLFCKMQAFSNGPIHLTSLIGSSSFILTTIFNAVYWKEKVNGWQIFGIALMLAAVIMITGSPKGGTAEKQKLTVKWKLYAAAFFVFSALTGIVFRFHQAADAAYTDEMMIFASVIVTAFLVVLGAGARIFKRAMHVPRADADSPADGPTDSPASGSDAGGAEGEVSACEKRRNVAAIVLLTLACGVVGCIYNRLNIYLSGAMANSVFFPLFNGGNIILTTLTGCILFREKLGRLQLAGIFCGLVAIVLVSDFFGLL